MKKFLALVLAILMVLSVAVVAVYAEDPAYVGEKYKGRHVTIAFDDGVEDEEIQIPDSFTAPLNDRADGLKTSHEDKLLSEYFADDDFYRLCYELTGFEVTIGDDVIDVDPSITLEELVTLQNNDGEYLLETQALVEGTHFVDGQTITLTAKWNRIGYAVIFDGNGGDGEMESICIEYNTIGKLPANTYTRDYFTFIGWYCDDFLGSARFITDENYFVNARQEDTTLKAVWFPHLYYVIFDGTGADAVEGGEAMEGQLVTAATPDATLDANKYSKVGYNFAGWATESDAVIADEATYADFFAANDEYAFFDKEAKTAFVTLTATWDPIWYNVEFDANGGEGEIEAMDVAYDDVIEFENTFTKANYHQIGWLDEENDVFYYIDEDLINLTAEEGDTIVLKAVWEGDARTVTYTDGVADKEIFKDQVYETNYGAATPAFIGTPKRDGYTFKGWDKEVAETVTDNVVYTAVWVENPKTGDATPVVLFAALALVSVMGMGYVVVRKNLSK